MPPTESLPLKSPGSAGNSILFLFPGKNSEQHQQSQELCSRSGKNLVIFSLLTA